MTDGGDGTRGESLGAGQLGRCRIRQEQMQRDPFEVFTFGVEIIGDGDFQEGVGATSIGEPGG